MNKTIQANGYDISILSDKGLGDFVSLTDIAKFKTQENSGYVIQNWMRNRNTIRFLALWEKMHNPDFNCLEFEAIEKDAGLNNFVLTPKRWIEQTHAIGIRSKQGRYAATYAHQDIAFEFASWISAEFKLYIVMEFQRLKAEEQKQIGWSVKRELTKLNYRIHTDAIKANLIPARLDTKQASYIYADEADVLNMALFGITAKQWRVNNPDKKGNIRDYANINQLICLANMESINAVFIERGVPQAERLMELNRIAIAQMKTLLDIPNRKMLVNNNDIDIDN